MYNKIRKAFYRKLAKRRLLTRYRYLVEIDKILEEFITGKIISGGTTEFISKGRQELVAKQSEISKTEKLIDFLSSIK